MFQLVALQFLSLSALVVTVIATVIDALGATVTLLEPLRVTESIALSA